jgi:hypothetical protein
MHELRRRLTRGVSLAVLLLAFAAPPTRAQSCQSSSDLDDATRSAITAAGQRFFAMAAKGDAASMRQNAAASIASDFSGIEAAVKDHQKDLADAKATVKSVYLLDAEGTAPLPHPEFYCGVFGKNGQTSTSAIFGLENLPPGKYAVVILDAAASKTRSSFSLILEKAANDWKLGGLYIRPVTAGGHDSEWFAARAREFKTKGQTHNAWLYFYEAWDLASPLTFMSTAATDKLYDEAQSALPPDIPTAGKTTDLIAGATAGATAGAATYKLTAIVPGVVGDDVDLIVKYKAADVSNTNQAYASNIAVIKALVAKFPEFKDAFSGVVARAVDPGGRDYGTLLAMKDVK